MIPPIRIDDVMTATDELANLLERENEALAANRLSELPQFQPDKDRLTAAYERHLRAIQADGALRAAVASDQGGPLRQIAKRLRKALIGNARLLQAAREANGRLLQAIVEAASEKRSGPSVYTRQGGVDTVGTKAGVAVPLAVDRQL
jgi:flagellar biosynthesis/type III secretory pathway chaperone